MTSVSSDEISKEEYSFVYGDQAVSYEVVRKPHPAGKKRKIAIKVNPNCEVVISAPDDALREELHEAVMKRAKWIVDALKAFRTHLEYVQAKNYVSGEMQFYLGRRYVLKVVEARQTVSSVKLLRGKLLVSLTSFNQNKTALTKSLVGKWYKHQAQRVFQARLNTLLPQTSWVNDPPSFRV